jgi:hypothetical protein
MEISCNVHASSFEKGDEEQDCDDVSELKTALDLSGLFYFSYTYPLSVAASFPHELTADMTGEDLLVLARGDYERIYREEEEAAGNPGHIPGMLNRTPSAGPYGIWGHDFNDLYFEGVEVDTEKRTISFGMGS